MGATRNGVRVSLRAWLSSAACIPTLLGLMGGIAIGTVISATFLLPAAQNAARALRRDATLPMGPGAVKYGSEIAEYSHP